MITGTTALRVTTIVLALLAPALRAADEAAAAQAHTVPVDAPAFVFSPGNWVGDDGRTGRAFRQTWNSGAYFRVSWESRGPGPAATLLLDAPPAPFKPQIAYCLDGVWRSRIAATGDIAIPELSQPGRHSLTVILHQSEQTARWGADGASGKNVLRVRGLQLDQGSVVVPGDPRPRWALIIGDSITEGIGASELASYAHLTGQALLTRGYEYGISACGWSGWLNKGDNPPGDVPGYYVISGSKDGAGGTYDDTASRWNKIDGNGHSLLDTAGRISAHGATGQEPSLILINYGTNDALHKSNPSDTRASMAQGLAALRKAAPAARIILLVPFGQYYAMELIGTVAAYRQAAPADDRVSVIDLGPALAQTLAAKNGLFGGLHPNDRGHANIAAALIPQILAQLEPARP